MKFLRYVLVFFSAALFILPSVILAAPRQGEVDNSMVPCGYDGAHGPFATVKGNQKPTIGVLNGKVDANEECTFNDFVRLAGNVLNGTVIIISVYAAISFMYAGYAYLTSGGSQEKVSYAKGIFKKVLIGYIIILTAWLVVSMLEKAFYSTTTPPDSFLQEGNPRL